MIIDVSGLRDGAVQVIRPRAGGLARDVLLPVFLTPLSQSQWKDLLCDPDLTPGLPSVMSSRGALSARLIISCRNVFQFSKLPR